MLINPFTPQAGLVFAEQAGNSARNTANVRLQAMEQEYQRPYTESMTARNQMETRQLYELLEWLGQEVGGPAGQEFADYWGGPQTNRDLQGAAGQWYAQQHRAEQEIQANAIQNFMALITGHNQQVADASRTAVSANATENTNGLTLGQSYINSLRQLTGANTDAAINEQGITPFLQGRSVPGLAVQNGAITSSGFQLPRTGSYDISQQALDRAFAQLGLSDAQTNADYMEMLAQAFGQQRYSVDPGAAPTTTDFLSMYNVANPREGRLRTSLRPGVDTSTFWRAPTVRDGGTAFGSDFMSRARTLAEAASERNRSIIPQNWSTNHIPMVGAGHLSGRNADGSRWSIGDSYGQNLVKEMALSQAQTNESDASFALGQVGKRNFFNKRTWGDIGEDIGALGYDLLHTGPFNRDFWAGRSPAQGRVYEQRRFRNQFESSEAQYNVNRYQNQARKHSQ